MKICQIVGYKNTGKTTVMGQLIQHLTKQGFKVGALKHHGHGGEPAMATSTDSYRHFTAGASISAVEGAANTELILPNIELNEMVRLYASIGIDILLMEGFKHKNFPKIVLVKNKEDVSLVRNLSAVIAVGSWNKDVLADADYPVFLIPNIETQLDMLAKIINEGC
ncbi:molybdopterin-guanine dinucleotide biosynthesis protein B [Lentibacillus sp. N15]|uniref:molybdopterin-guanine dinucleotide biosynthesis protein B n=1 Tax=Lentibacillus songyuanensis TaxID=3136161 RepID=UPI0031BAF55C